MVTADSQGLATAYAESKGIGIGRFVLGSVCLHMVGFAFYVLVLPPKNITQLSEKRTYLHLSLGALSQQENASERNLGDSPQPVPIDTKAQSANANNPITAQPNQVEPQLIQSEPQPIKSESQSVNSGTLLKNTLQFHTHCKYIPIRSASAPASDGMKPKCILSFHLGSKSKPLLTKFEHQQEPQRIPRIQQAKLDSDTYSLKSSAALLLNGLSADRTQHAALEELWRSENAEVLSGKETDYALEHYRQLRAELHSYRAQNGNMVAVLNGKCLQKVATGSGEFWWSLPRRCDFIADESTRMVQQLRERMRALDPAATMSTHSLGARDSK